MSATATRTRPLVAVLFRVPLFVESLAEAFDGVADLQAVRAEDPGVAGLLRALAPTALIVEGVGEPRGDWDVPVVHVDLERGVLCVLEAGEWRRAEGDISPEGIRNALFGAMLGGAR